MNKPMCVNLLEQYGDEFQVGFDPAYSAAGVPRSKLDCRYMRLECEKGIIFVHNDTRLTAEVEGRQVTRTRLRNLDCVTIVQDGDAFLAVTFDVGDFGSVAAVMRPRRKRQVSAEQRGQSRERMVQFNQQIPHPASVKRSKTHPDENHG
jgi:hypothetical protein